MCRYYRFLIVTAVQGCMAGDSVKSWQLTNSLALIVKNIAARGAIACLRP